MNEVKKEYNDYAQKVAVIGTQMNKTSEKFGNLSIAKIKTIEDISKLKDGYVGGLKEFQSLYVKLNSINPPKLIENEHSEMVESFKNYVLATEKMINSLDIENVKVNTDEYQSGIELQNKSSREIVGITQVIGDKISKAPN